MNKNDLSTVPARNVVPLANVFLFVIVLLAFAGLVGPDRNVTIPEGFIVFFLIGGAIFNFASFVGILIVDSRKGENEEVRGGDFPLYNSKCQFEEWRADRRSVGKGFTISDIQLALDKLAKEKEEKEKQEFGVGFHEGGHDQK